MTNKYFFKTKPGTDYDKAIKKHFELQEKWRKTMFQKVSELLGETITKMAFDPKELWVDLSEVENKDLFTKDGKLKANSKKSNEIRKKYIQIVKEEGLSEMTPLSNLNFIYGIIRHSRGETMKSYRTSENDIYYEADFDLEERSDGMVEPITEIEYQEKYLEEVKKREKVKESGY